MRALIDIENFLVLARTQTYASDAGKVQPVFAGSYQLEFEKQKWLYRDLYYNGRGIFTGLETIYFDNKPIWSLSYFGDFRKMTEEEADRILRHALVANKKTTRLYKKISQHIDSCIYTYNGSGDMHALFGREEIHNGDNLLYWYQCAGGYIEK
jgi:hypothetical protein